MRTKVGLAVLAGALALAVVAWAAPVTIPGPGASPTQPIKLEAAGDAYFDPYQPSGFDAYNDGCASGDVDSPDAADDLGYTPASDGAFHPIVANDEFDGGLVLLVGDRIFEDSDRSGDLVGEQLTVGPTKLGGLRVKRTDAALPGSPTLRSLVKLKNKSKRKVKKRTLTWESDLGADKTEVVRDTSSGDESLNDDDRWLVFADDDEEPSDAVGTLALYGNGKGVKRAKVSDPVADQNGCIKHTLRVKVPEKSSVYVLFFNEVHDATQDGVDDASSDAAKYNTKKPGGGVLDGLKKSVKRKVLNWDLAKGKP